MLVPRYSGDGLVNLVSELEFRLTGRSAFTRLRPSLAREIPSARSHVVVLFDGLGASQLEHPAAAPLSVDVRGVLDAPFSTQTAVATATLATGLPPSRHGLLSYLLRLPEAGGVVNCLWWFRTDGGSPDLDLDGFLPTPNLAERLEAARREAVVVEPEAFLGSPLDRVLYRGARTRGVSSLDELIEVTVEESSVPGRLVVAYLPHVDAACHSEGFGSDAYRTSLAEMSDVWRRLSDRLRPGTSLVGTADHGMVEPRRMIDVDPGDDIVLSGDSRVLHLTGPHHRCEQLAVGMPGRWVPLSDAIEWWGPGPRHPRFDDRAPTGLLVADPDVAFHHRGDPVRTIGHHGGLTEAELRIPLLVSG